MANFICDFEGVRGRILKLYDNKLIIITKKTVGSLITGNITDGEKTIFLSDIVGVQFKKSGFLIGYLQFETPSLQMNNKSDNMFSENTFTFEVNKNGITNELIEAVYNFVVDRIEEIKYGIHLIKEIPNFESMKKYSTHIQGDNEDIDEEVPQQNFNNKGENIDFETYDDISDFQDEIRNTSTEDLKLILEDQRELYSDDEIKIITEELQRRR